MHLYSPTWNYRTFTLWTSTLILLIIDCMGLHYKIKSDEEKLLDRLFKDYNPSARPVLNSSNTVTVDIQFSLLQIQDLNVRSQVFATTGIVILDWVDERLKWTPHESSLDQVVIDAKEIWRPEFAIINGAESIYHEYSEFQAVLYPTGRVRWEPGGVFKTMCQIDITYYPFDEQKCDLTFGAWSYYTSKMNLTTTASLINLDTYEPNGEWEILDTIVIRSEFAFECCPDQKFSNVKFTVYLRRRHTFYIMNVILPGILTSAVLLSIFFCTPQQKVHIGVASLLSFRLFLLNVADTIPRTSDHVPLLGVYLTCTMAITTLAMVATVFVLNLYGMKEKPVPYWAKKVFVIYMARILCMCNCVCATDTNDVERDIPKQHHRNRQRELVAHRGGARNRDEAMPLKGNRSIEVPAGADRRPSRQLSEGATAGNGHSILFMPSYEKHDKPKEKEKSRPDYAKDWVHVAAVFDRLFFWLCLVFIVVTTLLLFHPLTTSKYFSLPGQANEDEPSEHSGRR